MRTCSQASKPRVSPCAGTRCPGAPNPMPNRANRSATTRNRDAPPRAQRTQQLHNWGANNPSGRDSIPPRPVSVQAECAPFTRGASLRWVTLWAPPRGTTITAMDPPHEPLSSDQLAELDATYDPFPAFKDWPTEFPFPELWDEATSSLTNAARNADKDTLARAHNRAVRAASFDSGAIEGLYETDRGLTRTVAEQAASWEQRVQQHGPNALELFQAQLRTYELVMDVATKSLPRVTQAWVRRLHEEITAAQDTYLVHTPGGETQQQELPRGQYKRQPNHVFTEDGPHSYAPVGETQPEMARLCKELNSAKFAKAHPVLQAAYAHYAFVAIHPFADGNGRVARALASAYTYRAASVPLLILADERNAYFDALAAADRREAEPFIDFIARAARGAVDLVRQTLLAAREPDADREMGALRELRRAQGELSHEELDAAALGLIGALANIAQEKASALRPSEGTSVGVDATSGYSIDAPAGYRRLMRPSGGRNLRVLASSQQPAKAAKAVDVQVFVAVRPNAARTAVLVDDLFADPVAFALADISPRVSMAAELRLGALMDRLLGRTLKIVRKDAETSLRDQGYI